MCEPLYGFPSNMPSQEFVKVKGTNDVFYTYDEELDVNKLLSEPLPPPSIAINVVPHQWNVALCGLVCDPVESIKRGRRLRESLTRPLPVSTVVTPSLM